MKTILSSFQDIIIKYNIFNYIYCEGGRTVCLFTNTGKQKYKIEQKSNT